MGKWLLNTKKIKIVVRTCDAGDSLHKQQNCVQMKQEQQRVCYGTDRTVDPKMMMGHFSKHFTKDQWRSDLIHISG
jgi:hypothetical protein